VVFLHAPTLMHHGVPGSGVPKAAGGCWSPAQTGAHLPACIAAGEAGGTPRASRCSRTSNSSTSQGLARVVHPYHSRSVARSCGVFHTTGHKQGISTSHLSSWMGPADFCARCLESRDARDPGDRSHAPPPRPRPRPPRCPSPGHALGSLLRSLARPAAGRPRTGGAPDRQAESRPWRVVRPRELLRRA
jgi:hypothetical protein